MESNISGNLFDMEAMDGMLKINLVIGENKAPVIEGDDNSLLFCSSNNFKEVYTRWLKSAA